MKIAFTSRHRAKQLGADALVSVLSAIAVRARKDEGSPRPITSPAPMSTTAELSELIYELLDAHYDTAVLARELTSDAGWSAHLSYLCELQRVGRARLAKTAKEPVA